MPAFEHKVILENLQPLDSLELSRRYSEVQVQAGAAVLLGPAGPDTVGVAGAAVSRT